jgi:hypothetical protein
MAVLLAVVIELVGWFLLWFYKNAPLYLQVCYYFCAVDT